MASKTAVVVFLLCGYATAQFPYFGKCPSPDVQKDFDMKRFQGRWYEIERTMSFLQVGSRCTYTNFTDSGHGDGSYEVLNQGISPLFKLRKSVRLIAKVPDPNEPAKMQLRLSDLSLHGNYWVLDTDYDNYAIIWSCNHISLTFKHARTENLWVHSRQPFFTSEIQDKVSQKLKEIKYIRVKHLLKQVKQENCEYDPTTPSPEDNEV